MDLSCPRIRCSEGKPGTLGRAWGCGSECQASVVVDAQTGKVYSGPMASLGYKFKPNSRMIIANPPEDPSGYYSDFSSYSKPSVLIWDENKKEFTER